METIRGGHFAWAGLILVGALAGRAVVASEPGPTDWAQWRGAHRDGRVAAGTIWPENLSSLERRWRVELGPSYSGPIVAADRVFVTETRDRKREVVTALQRTTGEVLWRAEWDGAMEVPFFAKSNGDWIRATPAYDGEALYVAGMRDVLVALDAATGAVRWRVEFMDRYSTPLPAFGFVSSPLVDGEFLYVQAGGAVLKLSKKDGTTVWRTLEDNGGMEGSAFSSPILAELHGRRQLVVQTRQQLAGIDPASGTVLWSQVVPSYRGMNILTPTVYGNGVFTSTHKNRTYFYGIQVQDGAWSVKEEWNHRAQGYMSSPILHGDFAYLHLGNGRLTCLDLRRGEETWRTRSMGDYWSMVANGDRILGLNDEGKLHLMKADPAEFKLLDEKQLADQDTWGHLAVSGRELFVRELRAVAAWEWR